MIQLTLKDLNKVFLSVIQGKIKFDEAHNWAFEMMQHNDNENLEIIAAKDRSKIFSGLIFLLKVDYQISPGEYYYTLEDVVDEYRSLFNEKSNNK